MKSLSNQSTVPPNTLSLQRKITGVIWILRSLALVYTIWVLQKILHPALNSTDFLQRVGTYWNKDLLAGGVWQLWSAIGLNFFLWALLVLTVGCFWRASMYLLRDMEVSNRCSQWLRLSAWLGIATVLLDIFTRPLWSYLLTLHLSPPLWNLHLVPSDLLSVILCGAFLLLSYLVIWMSEIAEENKSFV